MVKLLIFDFGIGQIVMLILVVLVISAIFFRRYFSAFIYDYLVDGLLSYGDYLLAGAGAIGLDIGDWIAAAIILFKERKISGGFAAWFAAWEATNFIPFSFIPVLGEALEILLGFVPTVFFMRLMFNKYRPAESRVRRIEKNILVAEQAGINIGGYKKSLREAKQLMHNSNPVDALNILKGLDDKLSSELDDYTNNAINDAYDTFQYIASQNIEAPKELVAMLQQGLGQAEGLLEEAKSAQENKDFETAINAAINAKNIVIDTAEQFNQGFQQYQYQMQMQQGYV